MTQTRTNFGQSNASNHVASDLPDVQRRARILLIQRLIPSYREKIIGRVINELGWNVITAADLGDGDSIDRKILPGVEQVPFRPLGILGRTLLRVPLGALIQRYDPDAVVLESALKLTSTWLAPLRRRFMKGPPIYFWTIGYNPDIGIATTSARVRQLPYLSAYSLADGFLAYGKDGASFLHSWLGEKPTFIAQNTQDLDAIRYWRDNVSARPRLGFPELITVGRLTAPKRVPELVQALHRFRETYPNAVLTIIGDGPDRSAVERAAGPLLNTAVRVLGPSYDETFNAREMNAADAFIMSGRIGLSINYALGYGVPFVGFGRASSSISQGTEVNYLVDGVTGAIAVGSTARDIYAAVDRLFSRFKEPKAALRTSIDEFCRTQLSLDVMFQGFVELDQHVKRSLQDVNLCSEPGET